jgi:hypothetical protein
MTHSPFPFPRHPGERWRKNDWRALNRLWTAEKFSVHVPERQMNGLMARAKENPRRLPGTGFP